MLHTYNSLNSTAAPVPAAKIATHRDIAAAANPSPSADKVHRTHHISEQAKAMAQSDAAYRMDTGSGTKSVDLNTFFQPGGAEKGDILNLDGLLLPSENNVAALQNHVSKVFPQFLTDNNIPEAPSSIRYDSEGNMVLPADYAYADELKSALKDSPAMDRELRTLNALSSHLAAMKELEPFHYEFSQAENQAEIEAVIEKYKHLLNDNRQFPEVALKFEESGQVSVMADNKALV